jgi:hypothetical protein
MINLKKAGLILFAIFIICIAASCVTSSKLLSQLDPIALVSVVSNEDINWRDEEPTDPGLLSSLLSRRMKDDPDLGIITKANELINTAEILFRSATASSDLINLADKETVLNSHAYREAQINKYQVYKENVKPESYRLIDYRDKNFSSALARETGIQRSMFLEFDFTKFMAGGIGKNGQCRSSVVMNVIIKDANGKNIYKKKFTMWSTYSISVSAGAYSQSGLHELFESTLDKIYSEFLGSLK